MSRDFRQLLETNWKQGKFLCVGLDPDYEKIPESARRSGVGETIVAFNRAIIDATKDVISAYKPNSAFYEAHGDEGFAALRDTIQYVLAEAPHVAVILDAKRGDIGNTNEHYLSFAFDRMSADAITLHPFTGAEGLSAFLARKEKGSFIYCRSSNPGAREFQDLTVDGEPLYVRIARDVAGSWNGNGNCGLIVGATYPEELVKVRAVAPELPFLIPGTGAQHGDLAASVKAAKNREGGFILSVSRAILYASSNDDFAEAARAQAQSFDAAIRAAFV